jgi:alpha-D-ribose 1-methylphosphonate 5-triphosphate synthase subunit PhnG
MDREEINFILQKADLKKLKKLYLEIKTEHKVKVLQSPVQQTLLQPVRDPISGGEFYAGEVLVTTSIVTIGAMSHKGWAMVQDDNQKLSLYISVCDAAFGAGYFESQIRELVEKTKDCMRDEQAKLNQKINSTRVSFDLMK